MHWLGFPCDLDKHVWETRSYAQYFLYSKLPVATCDYRHNFLLALWFST